LTAAATPYSGRTAWIRNLAAPLRTFVATEVGSAAVLLAATMAALLWVNSPWGTSYEDVWGTELSIRLGGRELALDLRHWVNDGLMTLFFFVVGLEIRRELDMGELRDRRRVGVPVLAAIGGMAVPALLYLALNAGTDSARGWGVAMATDTAFALAVLTLVGDRCPVRLRIFLLTLVIVDDIGALLVIAGFYTHDVSLPALAAAVALYGAVLLVRRLHVTRTWPYALLGLGIWLAALESGIHPTIAGVAMGILTSAYPPERLSLERVSELWRSFREQPVPELARSVRLGVEEAISPNERLQYRLHPLTSYVVVPVFALANAGVDLGGGALADAARSRITIGIVVGLVVGKLVGIPLAAWLVTRPVFGGLPLTVGWPALVAGAAVCGIGFTVSLFIADLTFAGERLADAKIGILAASVLASLLAFVLFRAINRLPERLRTRLEGTEAEAILDLDPPVDPERDHVRGPAAAPVTLVEYGDFECPYCGQAESVVRALLDDFGGDLRYAWRHLPLSDVHEHAQLAAEASEAAAAQGAFWPMHDLLLAHQGELLPSDLRRYAETLGLDVGRFWDDVRTRRLARRVAEDVESADSSGVAGTPTFFVNGRRHFGAYDLETLGWAVRAAAVR
jgi:Na+/H+ antiporter NhaA